MKELRMRLSDPAHVVLKEQAEFNLRTIQGQAQWIVEAYTAGYLVERPTQSKRRPSKPNFATPSISKDGVTTYDKIGEKE